jgi:hypothetical protein
MKLKTVVVGDKTYAEISDGKPVFVHDDGKEIAFDGPAAMDRIKSLNGEAKSHREAKEAAETKLKVFEGLDDVEAARKALQTVANLKDKQLVEAGEVEKIKAGAIAAVEEKFKGVVNERDALKGERDKIKNDLDGLVRSNAFQGSKFVADKVAVPVHMLEKTFGDRFKVEDGKLVPYDAKGEKLFSRVKPGELAGFDEALEITIAADPFKDNILKGTNGGGGARSGGGGGLDMTGMSPVERMNAARAAR